MPDFEARLKGGHPNSLGNTLEIVSEVLDDKRLFEPLFNCYFSEDPVVRLRVSNAMKRICKQKKSWLVPYIDKFIEDISAIDQASTQWTLAQLFLELESEMSTKQIELATEIMQQNLAKHSDWIVLNQTMETLGRWSRHDKKLQDWMMPHLERLAMDQRKSVAKKAQKTLNYLQA